MDINSYYFSLFSYSISSSLYGRKNKAMMAMHVAEIRRIAGMGLSNSAANELVTVTVLAMKLQIPMAVARL